MPAIKSPKTQHVHSFVYYKTSGTGKVSYKCADPLCTKFYDKRLILGKYSLCPKCQVNTFELTREDLRRKMPVCLECSNTKAARIRRASRDLLKDIDLYKSDPIGAILSTLHEPAAPARDGYLFDEVISKTEEEESP